ncbi:MAG: 16S rRNA (adenine(1518)-N(6)/adenine(1519)-N(6))-dimethyltransferase RsmA [Alphaproteobacteria bacterium]
MSRPLEHRLPPLGDVIARYGLRSRKSLGQHFILDGNLTDRVVRAAGPLENINVIEVGPGPGGLTRSLLSSAARRVIVIERDRRCIPALEELAEIFPGRLEIVPTDALTVELSSVCPPTRKLIANLPYNAATRLLLKWLEKPTACRDMTLMFQREVAERLAATPGGKSYGRLSVLTQWLCEVSLLFDVSPKAFTPPPKVLSTVVRLVPRPKPLFPAEKSILERVTGAAFGQRRKMLRTSLRTFTEAPESLLSAAGVAGTARAEELSIQKFCALAEAAKDLTTAPA